MSNPPRPIIDDDDDDDDDDDYYTAYYNEYDDQMNDGQIFLNTNLLAQSSLSSSSSSNQFNMNHNTNYNHNQRQVNNGHDGLYPQLNRGTIPEHGLNGDDDDDDDDDVIVDSFFDTSAQAQNYPNDNNQSNNSNSNQRLTGVTSDGTATGLLTTISSGLSGLGGFLQPGWRRLGMWSQQQQPQPHPHPQPHPPTQTLSNSTISNNNKSQPQLQQSQVDSVLPPSMHLSNSQHEPPQSDLLNSFAINYDHFSPPPHQPKLHTNSEYTKRDYNDNNHHQPGLSSIAGNPLSNHLRPSPQYPLDTISQDRNDDSSYINTYRVTSDSSIDTIDTVHSGDDVFNPLVHAGATTQLIQSPSSFSSPREKKTKRDNNNNINYDNNNNVQNRNNSNKHNPHSPNINDPSHQSLYQHNLSRFLSNTSEETPTQEELLLAQFSIILNPFSQLQTHFNVVLPQWCSYPHLPEVNEVNNDEIRILPMNQIMKSLFSPFGQSLPPLLRQLYTTYTQRRQELILKMTADNSDDIDNKVNGEEGIEEMRIANQQHSPITPMTPITPTSPIKQKAPSNVNIITASCSKSSTLEETKTNWDHNQIQLSELILPLNHLHSFDFFLLQKIIMTLLQHRNNTILNRPFGPPPLQNHSHHNLIDTTPTPALTHIIKHINSNHLSQSISKLLYIEAYKTRIGMIKMMKYHNAFSITQLRHQNRFLYAHLQSQIDLLHLYLAARLNRAVHIGRMGLVQLPADQSVYGPQIVLPRPNATHRPNFLQNNSHLPNEIQNDNKTNNNDWKDLNYRIMTFGHHNPTKEQLLDPVSSKIHVLPPNYPYKFALGKNAELNRSSTQKLPQSTLSFIPYNLATMPPSDQIEITNTTLHCINTIYESSHDEQLSPYLQNINHLYLQNENDHEIKMNRENKKFTQINTIRSKFNSVVHSELSWSSQPLLIGIPRTQRQYQYIEHIDQDVKHMLQVQHYGTVHLPTNPTRFNPPPQQPQQPQQPPLQIPHHNSLISGHIPFKLPHSNSHGNLNQLPHTSPNTTNSTPRNLTGAQQTTSVVYNSKMNTTTPTITPSSRNHHFIQQFNNNSNIVHALPSKLNERNLNDKFSPRYISLSEIQNPHYKFSNKTNDEYFEWFLPPLSKGPILKDKIIDENVRILGLLARNNDLMTYLTKDIGIDCDDDVVPFGPVQSTPQLAPTYQQQHSFPSHFNLDGKISPDSRIVAPNRPSATPDQVFMKTQPGTGLISLAKTGMNAARARVRSIVFEGSIGDKLDEHSIDQYNSSLQINNPSNVTPSMPPWSDKQIAYPAQLSTPSYDQQQQQQTITNNQNSLRSPLLTSNKPNPQQTNLAMTMAWSRRHFNPSLTDHGSFILSSELLSTLFPKSRRESPKELDLFNKRMLSSLLAQVQRFYITKEFFTASIRPTNLLCELSNRYFLPLDCHAQNGYVPQTGPTLNKAVKELMAIDKVQNSIYYAVNWAQRRVSLQTGLNNCLNSGQNSKKCFEPYHHSVEWSSSENDEKHNLEQLDHSTTRDERYNYNSSYNHPNLHSRQYYHYHGHNNDNDDDSDGDGDEEYYNHTDSEDDYDCYQKNSVNLNLEDEFDHFCKESDDIFEAYINAFPTRSELQNYHSFLPQNDLHGGFMANTNQQYPLRYSTHSNEFYQLPPIQPTPISSSKYSKLVIEIDQTDHSDPTLNNTSQNQINACSFSISNGFDSVPMERSGKPHLHPDLSNSPPSSSHNHRDSYQIPRTGSILFLTARQAKNDTINNVKDQYQQIWNAAMYKSLSPFVHRIFNYYHQFAPSQLYPQTNQLKMLLLQRQQYGFNIQAHNELPLDYRNCQTLLHSITHNQQNQQFSKHGNQYNRPNSHYSYDDSYGDSDDDYSPHDDYQQFQENYQRQQFQHQNPQQQNQYLQYRLLDSDISLEYKPFCLWVLNDDRSTNFSLNHPLNNNNNYNGAHNYHPYETGDDVRSMMQPQRHHNNYQSNNQHGFQQLTPFVASQNSSPQQTSRYPPSLTQSQSFAIPNKIEFFTLIELVRKISNLYNLLSFDGTSQLHRSPFSLQNSHNVDTLLPDRPPHPRFVFFQQAEHLHRHSSGDTPQLQHPHSFQPNILGLNHTCNHDIAQAYHSTSLHQGSRMRRDDASRAKHNLEVDVIKLSKLQEEIEEVDQIDRVTILSKKNNHHNKNNITNSLTEQNPEYAKQWIDPQQPRIPVFVDEITQPCQLCALSRIPRGGVLHLISQTAPHWFTPYLSMVDIPQTQEEVLSSLLAPVLFENHTQNPNVTLSTPNTAYNGHNLNSNRLNQPLGVNYALVDSVQQPEIQGDFFVQLICELIATTTRIRPSIIDLLGGGGWFVPNTIRHRILHRKVEQISVRLNSIKTAQQQQQQLHQQQLQQQQLQQQQLQQHLNKHPHHLHQRQNAPNRVVTPTTINQESQTPLSPTFGSINHRGGGQVTTSKHNNIFTLCHLYELFAHIANMNLWLMQFFHNNNLSHCIPQYPSGSIIDKSTASRSQTQQRRAGTQSTQSKKTTRQAKSSANALHSTTSTVSLSIPSQQSTISPKQFLHGIYTIPSFPTFQYPLRNVILPQNTNLQEYFQPCSLLTTPNIADNFQHHFDSHHPQTNTNFPYPHSHYTCLCETILWYHAYYSSHPHDYYNSGWVLNTDWTFDFNTLSYTVLGVPKSLLTIDSSIHAISPEMSTLYPHLHQHNQIPTPSTTTSTTDSVGVVGSSTPVIGAMSARRSSLPKVSSFGSLHSSSIGDVHIDENGLRNTKDSPQSNYLIHSLISKRVQYFLQKPPQIGHCLCPQCSTKPMKCCLLCVLPTFRYLSLLAPPSIPQHPLSQQPTAQQIHVASFASQQQHPQQQQQQQFQQIAGQPTFQQPIYPTTQVQIHQPTQTAQVHHNPPVYSLRDKELTLGRATPVPQTTISHILSHAATPQPPTQQFPAFHVPPAPLVVLATQQHDGHPVNTNMANVGQFDDSFEPMPLPF